MGWTAAAEPARSSSARRNLFSCDSLSEAVLLAAGRQRGGEGPRLPEGAVLSVAEGQCALLVSRGKVFDLCAEAGSYTYDRGSVPDPLFGELDRDASRNLYPYPPDAGDIRLYYVSTRAAAPLPFKNERGIPYHLTLPEMRLDIDISLFCEGSFRCRVCDPALFFTNVTGPVEDRFDSRELHELLTRQLETALPAALARLSAKGTPFPFDEDTLRSLEAEIAASVEPIWRERLGLCLSELTLCSVRSDEESQRLLDRFRAAAALLPKAPASAEAWFCPDCGAKSTGNFCPQCGKKKPALFP